MNLNKLVRFNKTVTLIITMSFSFVVSLYAATDVVKLKMADAFPPSHKASIEGAVYWSNLVQTYTNGEVQIDYFPAQQLGKAKDMINLLQNKVADIAYIAPSYVSNKLPLSGVGMLPGFIKTSQEGTKAYWKLIENYLLEEEFLKNGIRPLWVLCLPKYGIATTGKPLNSIDDLNGLKVRTAGVTQEFMIRKLGAIPVAIPAQEIMIALQRGTVDATTTPIGSLRDYPGGEDIMSNVAADANVGSFIMTYCINESVWQKMPSNVKEAMLRASQETMDHISLFYDEKTISEVKNYPKSVVMCKWNDADLLKQKEAANMTRKMWAEMLDKGGHKGTETVEKFEKLVE